MRAASLAVCLFSLSTFVSLAQEAKPPLTLAATLQQVRAALNVAALPPDHPGLKANGTIRQYGLDEKYDLLLDGQARFRTQTTGPLAETRGFDGTEAWMTDWTKTTRRLSLRDRDLALTNTWLVTGLWAVRPELFELNLVEEKSTEKEVVLKVRRKEGLFPLEVTVERASGRPTKAVGKLRDHEHVYTLGGYAGGAGFQLPREWSHTAAGVTTAVKLNGAEKLAAADPAAFAFKPQRSQQAKFDPAKPGKLEAKKALSGHLLVKPTIGGEDVGWFIFDSGAGHMCIDKQLAAKLELETFGEIPVGGVGATIKSKFCKSARFDLGPASLQDPTYIELDLKGIGAMMGAEIGGIVGYPLLQAAAVEIDCFAPALTLHDPATYRLPEGTDWTKLVIDSNHPIVEGKYEGDRRGWFRLDTGATNSVSFHTPAVVRHKLLEGRKTQTTLQGGVGGMVRSQAGALEWFELAGHRFPNLPVIFAQAEKGAFADEYTDGNLGQAVLRPFSLLVFDYGGERLAFVKKKE